jgi:hypothetical protein
LVARVPPLVDFGRIGENRPEFAVLKAVDGKAITSLPSLNGTDVTAKVGGNLLP